MPISPVHVDPDKLAQGLAALGYPVFAHLPSLEANPAAVLLDALYSRT